MIRLVFLLLALGLAPSASAQSFGLPSAAPPPVADRPSGLADELASREQALEARLGVLQSQARWAVERSDARRRQLEDEERTFLATKNRRARGEEADLWAQTLAAYQRLLREVADAGERWDSRVDQLLDAVATIRGLRHRLDDPVGGEGWTADELDRALAHERGSLAALDLRHLAATQERLKLQAAVSAARERIDSLRAQLVEDQLAAFEELVPPPEGEGEADEADEAGGAPEEDEAAVGAQAEEPPPAPRDDPLAESRQRLNRLDIRLAERALERARHDLERGELRDDVDGAERRVREARVASLGRQRDDLASFEEGGLLARGRTLLDPADREATVSRSLELLRDPTEGPRLLAASMWARPASSIGELLGFSALFLVLLGLGVRLDRHLARQAPKATGLQVGRATLRGAIRGAPPAVAVLVAGALGLVRDQAWLFLMLLGAVPAMVTAVWWLSAALRDAAEALEADTAAVLRVGRSLRTSALLGALALVGAETLDTLDFPPAAGEAMRFGLVVVLAALWARIALRPAELLTLLEGLLALPLPPAVRSGIQAWRQVAALVPPALLAVWAGGFRTLANYLAGGLLWSLAVLVLTPLLWRAGREALGWGTGHPGGGGPLALSEGAARAIHKGLMPLLLLAVAGLALAGLSAAWGQGAPLSTVGQLLTRPLLQVGGSSISPGSVALFGGVLAGTLLATRWLVRFLGDSVYPLYDLDDGSRASLDTVVRYSGLGLGVAVALDVAGVGVGVLTVFAGVLGIGIGFGSQTLAANFISGLILLLARPIAVGDTIEVGDLIGRVVRISSYATLLRTLDNTMVVVPNSKIVDESVINWSLGERRVRLKIAVGVAYGSDVDTVQRLLLQAAGEVDGLLKRPHPVVRFDDFGDSALLFRVLPWTTRVDDRMLLGSALRYRIDELFREAGVVIAFPQLDVHMRAAEGTSSGEPADTP